MLASGSGTNLQKLIDTPDLSSRLALVVSDNSGAFALNRAERAGIPTAVLPWSDFSSREEFSVGLADRIEEAGCKGVVLAGFMRILSPSFIDRFPNRILNIHPSLLPAFPGGRAVEDALEHGAKVTGVTVHFVDERVDHGPIIAQRVVEVRDDDDRDSLHARIQAEEHSLYPRVVRAFVEGSLLVEGRKVTWR